MFNNEFNISNKTHLEQIQKSHRTVKDKKREDQSNKKEEKKERPKNKDTKMLSDKDKGNNLNLYLWFK